MNSKTKIVIICCSVVGVILLLTGTFAYFNSSDGYKVSGQVINWSFKAENNLESFTKMLGDIEPGTEGSFVISLDPSSATTDVECTITPNLTDSLSGLKLYSDSGKTNAITNDNPLALTLTAKSAAKSVTIYWKWEYDNGLLTNTNVSFSMNIVGKQITS